MSVADSYLRYAHRRPGMDHDRYPLDNAFARPPLVWPGGARVAVWIMPMIEFFPFDMPLNLVPGGMTRPYPDYWNYTLRDYGNRVGVYRILRALDAAGFPASVAFNAVAAERDRFLVQQVRGRGWEVVGMGLDMAHLHSSVVPRDVESAWVQAAMDRLRRAVGEPVRGWVSPGLSESFVTPDLLGAAGVEYLCDWMNDELPYRFRTEAGELIAMPHGHELSDLKLIGDYGHTASQYAEQVIDSFDFLYREAADEGGRILSLPLRPWITGAPHRIAALERILKHMASRAGVWATTGSAILDAWREQAGRA